jgi:hypothetical protein
VSSRVDEAIKDPRTLWALILEDEQAGNADELGEIAERLYVGETEALCQVHRLQAQVHSLAHQLRRPTPG